VVIFVFWQKYENEQCQIYSDRFIEAQNLISQERCDEALAVIKDIENRNLKAYSVLSKLLRSAIFVTRDFEKNAEEIQKIYQAILQDRSAPVYIKELAAVLYVNAYLQQFKTIDDDAAKKLVKILETYINKKSKKGISLLARELTGLIAFLTNNMEEARRVFDSLCREDISPDARYRFSLMIQAIQDSE
jgi:pentatricopeptide repeat protein